MFTFIVVESGTSHMEGTMKLRAKLGVSILALMFVLASAYIAHAGNGMDQAQGLIFVGTL